MKASKWLGIFILLFALGATGCGSDSENTADKNSQGNPINTGESNSDNSTSYSADFIAKVEAGEFFSEEQAFGLRVFEGGLLREGRTLEIYYARQDFSHNTSSSISFRDFWDNLRNSFSVQTCSGSNCFEDMIAIKMMRNRDQIQRSQNFSIDEVFGSTRDQLKFGLANKLRSADKILKCFGPNYCVDQNNLSPFQQEYESSRYVAQHGNRMYVIDLTYPLISNPVSIYDGNEGKIYNVHNWYVY